MLKSMMLFLVITATIAAADVSKDFVWPVFFPDSIPGSMDMGTVVPGYDSTTTTLELLAVSSISQYGDTSLHDSMPLPSNITFDGRRIKYDGTPRIWPWAFGAFKLRSTNPSWLSNKFNVVVGPEPKWIGGNGEWDKGTANRSFSTLSALVASIPDTGGWAQIPNTRVKTAMDAQCGGYPDCLRGALKGVSAGLSIVGNGGPYNLFDIWATAAFNGSAFTMGAVGGHYSHWGNDMYRVRFTDPPAVTMLHMPFPIGAALNRGNQAVNPPYGSAGGPLAWKPPYCWARDWDEGDYSYERCSPVWGPGATHQYQAFQYCPANGKYLMGGSNQWYCTDDTTAYTMLWELDLNAETPRQAWRPIALPDNPFVAGGFYHMLELDNGDMAFTGSPKSYIYHQADGSITAETHPFMASAGGTGGVYLGWRNPYSGKSYSRNENSAGTAPSLYCLDDQKHVATLPVWTQYDATTVDNIAGIAFTDSNTAVMFNATGSKRTCVVNLTTGEVREFYDPNGPTGSQQGSFGKFAYIPEANCFVAMVYVDQNAWVFRPPASWNINPGTTAKEIAAHPLTAARLSAQPNPFTASTTIRFTLPEGIKGAYSIYSVTGKCIRTFSVQGGLKTMVWDGKDAQGKPVAAGLYAGKLILSSGKMLQHRLALMK